MFRLSASNQIFPSSKQSNFNIFPGEDLKLFFTECKALVNRSDHLVAID